MYYLCVENKGADQLCGNRAADLRLCFRMCKSRFSDDTAHLRQTTIRPCTILHNHVTISPVTNIKVKIGVFPLCLRKSGK